MPKSPPPDEEIRRRGIEALTRELGPVGMARFLRQFEASQGQGDYTRQRHQWLSDADVQALSARVRQRRQPSTES